jgi:hypothetical protein
MRHAGIPVTTINADGDESTVWTQFHGHVKHFFIPTTPSITVPPKATTISDEPVGAIAPQPVSTSSRRTSSTTTPPLSSTSDA